MVILRVHPLIIDRREISSPLNELFLHMTIPPYICNMQRGYTIYISPVDIQSRMLPYTSCQGEITGMCIDEVYSEYWDHTQLLPEDQQYRTAR